LREFPLFPGERFIGTIFAYLPPSGEDFALWRMRHRDG
jgi:hypothetical protein